VSHQSIQSPTQGVAETILASPLVMGLSLYTEHQLDLSMTLPITEDSRLYNNTNFEINSLLLDTGTPPLVRSRARTATRRSSRIRFPLPSASPGDEAPRSRYSQRRDPKPAGSSANFTSHCSARQTRSVTAASRRSTRFCFVRHLRSAESALDVHGQPPSESSLAATTTR